MEKVFRVVSAVLLMALGVCSVIDTKSFLYLSMSQTLTAGLVELMMLLTVTMHVILCKTYILPKFAVITFIVVWILYLLFHSSCMVVIEEYRLLYFVESLLFVLVVTYMLQNRLLTKSILDNCICMMAVIQLTSLIMQSVGMCSSYSGEFSLTGISENPNVTAILLIVCVPSVVSRFLDSKYPLIRLTVMLLILLYVFLLRCRTAYLGLGIMAAGYIASIPRVRRRLRMLSVARAFSLIMVMMLLSSMLSIAAYRMKPDSVVGRMLIWKLSSGMIVDAPMGHGFGMFEKEYNLRQAEYFSTAHASRRESMLASNVYMAYNDYLEQGGETGVPGLLFLIAFHILIAVYAYRNKRKVPFIVIIAYLIMSSVNFMYASIQPWTVLMMYASMSVYSTEIRPATSKPSTRLICMASLVLFLVVLVPKHIRLLASQANLFRISQTYNSYGTIDLPQAKKLRAHIGSSEAYCQFMAHIYMDKGEYDKALESLEEAGKLSSSPYLYLNASECYRRIGKLDKAIAKAETIMNMIPQNLTSRHRLMILYHQKGDREKALRMAEIIVGIPLKISNGLSDRIRNNAMDYIRDNK